MDIQIVKWGNSLAIRIPSKIASSLGVEEGTMAELSSEDGQLVLTPKRKYTLESLVAKIKPSNLHSEISGSREVGAEVIE